MTKKKSEKRLANCGLAGDPQHPVMRIESEAIPDDSWDLDQLAHYATVGLAESGRLGTEALQLARRSTVQTFWAGCALLVAHEKLKAERRWVRWLKEHNIPRTSAWEAEELFKRCGSEEAIAGLTLTQAKNKYRITKTVKGQPETVPCVSSRQGHGGRATSETNEDKPSVLSLPEAHEQTGEDGYDSAQWEDESAKPPKSADSANTASTEDTVAVLVLIVDRLEYLVPDVERLDWSKESAAKNGRLVVDRGIQVFERIRGKMVAA